MLWYLKKKSKCFFVHENIKTGLKSSSMAVCIFFSLQPWLSKMAQDWKFILKMSLKTHLFSNLWSGATPHIDIILHRCTKVVWKLPKMAQEWKFILEMCLKTHLISNLWLYCTAAQRLFENCRWLALVVAPSNDGATERK